MASSTELTAADIARIAGVGRAAVSNWRRRHADFPRPVGGPATSPVFALDEVERWLAAGGRVRAAGGEPARRAEPDLASLAGVLVALLPAVSGGIVLDPVCVDESCLAAAATRFGGRTRYVGGCLDPDEVERVKASLAALGAGKVDVVDGRPFDDALAGYVGRSDAVVSVPPMMPGFTFDDAFDHRWEFGPPDRGDAALAWVQAGYAYLKPGGTAVLALPFSAASRASGRRIRADLLRAGALTHVIALPERPARPMGPWHIWVLQRPTGRPAYTLRLVDLTDRKPEEVPATDDQWAAVFADAALTRDVPSIELLDDEVLLVPSMHVAAQVRDVAPEYRRIGGRFREAAAALPEQPPPFSAATPPDLPLVSIADLARVGALEIRDRRPDIEPGDVVIPYGPDRFDSVTVATAASMDQRGVTVIRCDPDQLDPYFLACFLRSAANRRQAVGTLGGTYRLDLRRARVPRIPLAEQRRYGDAFRRLAAFAATAAEVAAAANEAVQTAVYGLTTGTFAPTSPDNSTAGSN